MNFELYFTGSKVQSVASDGEGCCRYSYAEEHEYVNGDKDLDKNNTDNNIHDSDSTTDNADNGKILERR